MKKFLLILIIVVMIIFEFIKTITLNKVCVVIVKCIEDSFCNIKIRIVNTVEKKIFYKVNNIFQKFRRSVGLKHKDAVQFYESFV